MARYAHLRIWKDASSLAVLPEEAVRRFPRYHQHALGADLRRQAYAPQGNSDFLWPEGHERSYAVCQGVVAEDGYRKRGLKRRMRYAIGWRAQPAHSKFASTPSSGACYAS
jgi:hypothetical protein